MKAVQWRPRGIGYGGGYASLATGRLVSGGPDLSGFVATRADAYALADLFSPISKWEEDNRDKARVGEYVDRCYIDFRTYEPNWLQVKVCVEQGDIAFLERLNLIASLQNGWIDKDTVNWVMSPDTSSTPCAIFHNNVLQAQLAALTGKEGVV